MAILGALVVVCCVSIVAFQVWQNRLLWIEHCEGEAMFIAEHSDELVIWDDRVALRDLLDDLVADGGHFRYAFVEVAGSPYVHTFRDGVPVMLMEKPHSLSGKTSVNEYRDTNGEVFYDISAVVAVDDTFLHLGMDRSVVDASVWGVVWSVLLLGGVLLVLCLYPAWITAGSITHEADLASRDLKELNAELEARVEERSLELKMANEELEMEMARRIKLEKRQTDLYAMMRHDMKNTLSIIGANAQLLGEEYGAAFNEETRGMLKAIQDNSRSMSAMIEDIAVISGLDSDNIPLNTEELDVTALILEACIGISKKAADKGLNITRDIPEELPPVLADSSYMRRAVMNLLTNAVNYTPGGETVKVGAQAVRRGDTDYVDIYVSDTGPGISQEEQGKVFNMYYRSATSRGVRGSGLGLAIVKAVMEAHNGSVELECPLGSGCTFRLLLPVLTRN